MIFQLIEPCDQTMAYSSELMTIWSYSSVSIAVAVFILNVIDYYLLRNASKQHGLCMFLIHINDSKTRKLLKFKIIK